MSGSGIRGGTGPSTGTSADNAGTAGTTAPRSPDTSVGTSGARQSTVPDNGRCDTRLGEERAKCLRERAATGTAGPGSTGMGSSAGGSGGSTR